jgi:hypothetical protein
MDRAAFMKACEVPRNVMRVFWIFARLSCRCANEDGGAASFFGSSRTLFPGTEFA